MCARQNKHGTPKQGTVRNSVTAVLVKEKNSGYFNEKFVPGYSQIIFGFD